MKIIFACGGTGGHINPALAVARTIQTYHPNAQIAFVGNEKGMESRLVPQAGYEFYPIHVAGFQRKISVKNVFRNISAARKAVTSGFEAGKILKKFAPDLVVGMGGYVSGPVVRKAHKMGIKTAIHEQNAFPGLTTKMLVKHVDTVMLAMPAAQKHLPEREYVITGNPVRPDILNITKQQARARLSMDDQHPFILSFGGSLGAECINRAMAEVMTKHWNTGKYYHYHGTGKQGWEWMSKHMKDQGVDFAETSMLRMTEYINDMDLCMAAADLVVSRAGAITLSEIEVQGKASILIPSPYVAENHQYHNAMTLQDRGAALVVEEKNLNGVKLFETMEKLLADPVKMEKMGKAAKDGAFADANERIYATLMSLLS
ncbi:MAG: undecaprenyldiphospho-muramoylpentapeptide beta-N-acetylglucosaminyltransferase [Clostridia bacterium]|nr:undecaprenyldiphospho-muramoylpentapeptide beta-N-acetylglucosaminyltransferase [Clostridia bacterium]